MEPLSDPIRPSAPAEQAAAPTSDPSDGYAPVTGRSLAEVEKVRQLESLAAQKTARDYEHVVWAYGVLWALFAAYGIFLWRRGSRIRADLEALRGQLEQGRRA
jgi:hypothetical protein